MAFRKGNQGSNDNGNSNGWQPSDAFVNIYLESKDAQGAPTRRKIGAIPLKSSKAYEGALIKRLTEGGAEALEAMKGKIVLDFQRTDKEVKVSDLPF